MIVSFPNCSVFKYVCAFKRNYYYTSYYAFIFKWIINENCPQLLKKEDHDDMRGQWQICPDASWWSHSQKLMPIKLSKHRTNKDKVSSHHVKAHCCGNFGDKPSIFFTVTISHALNISYKVKKSFPMCPYHRADYYRVAPFSCVFPSHPCFSFFFFSPKHNAIFDETRQ